MKRLAIIITTLFALTAAASAESDPKKVAAILEGAKVCNATADPVACMTGFMAALGIEPTEEKAAEVVVETVVTPKVEANKTEEMAVADPALIGTSDIVLCRLATRKPSNGIVTWEIKAHSSKTNNDRAVSWVTEAKKRGLDCGVNKVAAKESNTLKNVTDDKLCRGAAVISGMNKRSWYERDYAKGYMAEAQRRGLDCGVGDSSDYSNINESDYSNINEHLSAESLKSSFKYSRVLIRKQTQYALKELGYYKDTIDGKWGKNTERALLGFIQKNNYFSPHTRPIRVFSILRQTVSVPTSFASSTSSSSSSSSSTSSSNSSSNSKTSDTFYENSKITLRAIDSKPDVSAKRALHVCQAVANSARDGTTARKSNPYGYSANCNSIYGNTNCSILPQSGGMWGGLADGLANVFAKNRAAKNAAIACFADRGWAATFK